MARPGCNKAMLMDVQTKLENYHEKSTSASRILSEFEDRLQKMELTILPVYNETEHLQRRQHSEYKPGLSITLIH